MISQTIRKVVAGAGIATAMTIGLASITTASADPWDGGWGHHERWEHRGPRFGYYPPPPVYYYPRPVHCFTRRVMVWGPWGYHPVFRRICRR